MRSAPAAVLVLLATIAVSAWGFATLPQPVIWQRTQSLKLGKGQSLRGPIEMDGLPRLFRLDGDVYSGGKPGGQPAFQSLADLGVKTVISVDGEEPDVEAAEAAGLRSVHLPIGYDGVPRSRIVELVVALRELPKPVYIHCHRGLHRGPAAAVAACRAAGRFAMDENIDALLEEMGTASKYAGLYRDAREAKPLTIRERQSLRAENLPSRTTVAPLTQQMVDLEYEWEHLTKSVKDQPEWTPELVSAATGLSERLFEAGRLLAVTSETAALRAALIADGRWLAESVEARADTPEAITGLMKQRCDVCHARFRNH